jgi:hypothetical protein
MGRPVVDLTGQRFGRLVAIRSVGRKFGGNTYWLCRCDCGAEKEIRGSALRSKKPGTNVWSCGCGAKERCAELGRLHGPLRRTHGGSGTPAFVSWVGMIRRCHDASHPSFAHYGGKGIAVCDRWRASFKNFLADMGMRPAGRTLNRKLSSGNYEPGNCEWATQEKQHADRSCTIWLTHQGETLPMARWAQRLGVSIKTLWSRRRLGWPDSKIVSTPIKRRA